jgi:hypothetical protein
VLATNGSAGNGKSWDMSKMDTMELTDRALAYIQYLV